MPKRSDLILNMLGFLILSILGFAETHCLCHPAHFAARPPTFPGTLVRTNERAPTLPLRGKRARRLLAFGCRPREASGGQARWRTRILRVRTHSVGESTTLRSKRSLAYPPCF